MPIVEIVTTPGTADTLIFSPSGERERKAAMALLNVFDDDGIIKCENCGIKSKADEDSLLVSASMPPKGATQSLMNNLGTMLVVCPRCRHRTPLDGLLTLNAFPSIVTELNAKLGIAQTKPQSSGGVSENFKRNPYFRGKKR